jgi:glycerophosphoryl diester phosphodiesterase
VDQIPEAIEKISRFFTETVLEFLAKVVSEILLGLIVAAVFYLRRVIARQAALVYHALWQILTGRRFILLWIDASQVVVERLAIQLQPHLRDASIRILRSPAGLMRYPMRPRFTEAIVLIITDVSKLATEDKVRDRLQERLETYLLRGGALIGAHDIIYRRSRNERLQHTFGCSVTQFMRMDEPVVYERAPENQNHPIAKAMPARFSLKDGEVIWGKWAADATPLFTTPGPERRNLVVVRNYQRGRVVWLNSGDHDEHVCASIGEPQSDFVQLLAASIKWAAQQRVTPRNYPFVVAHRGASAVEPENSAAAFRAAVKMKADYIECDVRKTKDGTLVINHDAGFCGQTISGATMAELRKAAQANKVELVTFDQLLQLAKDIRLDIELKETGYEEEVLRALQRHHWGPEDFVFTSFHDHSIQRIKWLSPATRCGLLLGVEKPKNPARTRLSELFPLRRLKACNADFVAPHFRLMRFAFARRLTAGGFPIWVWTVDDSRRIARLMRTRGVEAVITDVPDAGLKARAEMYAKLTSRIFTDDDGEAPPGGHHGH